MLAIIPELCKDLGAQEGAGSPRRETRGTSMPEERAAEAGPQKDSRHFTLQGSKIYNSWF